MSVIKTQILRAHDAFPGRITFIGYAQCLKMGNPNNLKVRGRNFTDKTVRRPTSRSTLEHILTQTNQSAHTHTAWLLETRHQTRDKYVKTYTIETVPKDVRKICKSKYSSFDLLVFSMS